MASHSVPLPGGVSHFQKPFVFQNSYIYVYSFILKNIFNVIKMEMMKCADEKENASIKTPFNLNI